MSIGISDNFQNNSGKALDNKYLSGGTTLYSSVAAANAAIFSVYRHRGLKVLIDVGGAPTEYWYKEGTADLNLVEYVDLLTVTNGTGVSDRAQLASAPDQLTLQVKSIGISGSNGISVTRISNATTEDWVIDGSSLVLFASGTYANRPLTGLLGQQYFQTDLLVGLYMYDGNNWIFMPDGNTMAWCKFLGNTYPLNGNTSGSGASHAQSSSKFSAWELSTGTTSSGISQLRTSQDMSLGGTTGKIIQYSKVTIPTLSDGTNRFVVRIGRPAGTEGVGIWFRYTDNVNSGKFQVINHNGVTPTTNDSGITAVAGTEYEFVTVFDQNGIDNIKYYINNVLVGTSTTNLPTTFAGGYYGSISIEKTAGNTARTLVVDDVTIKRILG